MYSPTLLYPGHCYDVFVFVAFMSAMDVLLELVLRGAEKDRANNEKTGHGHLPKNQPSLFLAAATAAASLQLLKEGEEKLGKG